MGLRSDGQQCCPDSLDRFCSGHRPPAGQRTGPPHNIMSARYQDRPILHEPPSRRRKTAAAFGSHGLPGRPCHDNPPHKLKTHKPREQRNRIGDMARNEKVPKCTRRATAERVPGKPAPRMLRTEAAKPTARFGPTGSRRAQFPSAPEARAELHASGVADDSNGLTLRFSPVAMARCNNSRGQLKAEPTSNVATVS